MKKICTVFLIQLLLLSAAFGQEAKPKKKWAVGVYGGPTVLLGSLNSAGKYLNGFDAGILGQKAFSDVLSLRVDFGYSKYTGYDDVPTLANDKVQYTAFSQYYTGTETFVLNYQTTMYYGDVVMVLNVPIHTLFGKEKGKFNWYVFAGAGFNANKVMGNGIDDNDNPYDFSDYSGRRRIPWTVTKDRLDNSFETDLRNKKYIEIGDEMELRPEFVGGTGAEWAFNDVWEVFAEAKFMTAYDDREMDGVSKDGSGSTGGLDIPFAGRVGLKWRFHTNDKDKTGIDWFSNTAAMQYNRTLSVEDKIAGVYSDTDGDGVPDYLDKEPNTPGGANVDGSGRSMDVDYDGIPDYADDDLFTVKGSEVDENGKGIDTDGDGVPDGIDVEPNTPKGKLVNFQGVAIDDIVKPAASIPSIFFDYNSSDLRPEYLSSLASVIAVLKDRTSSKVMIIGHTDNVGSEKFNNQLGLKRAEAIKELLVQAGVSSDRIITETKGKVSPIAEGQYKVSSMMNRRAEIKIID